MDLPGNEKVEINYVVTQELLTQVKDLTFYHEVEANIQIETVRKNHDSNRKIHNVKNVYMFEVQKHH